MHSVAEDAPARNFRRMTSVISHTAKQQLFLDALLSEEVMGDLRTAMRIAGYSDNTKIAHTARELRKEIKEATETLLALYAPRHVHTKTVKYSEAIQLKLGGLTCLRQPRYPFTLTPLLGERLVIRRCLETSCASVVLFCLPVSVSSS